MANQSAPKQWPLTKNETITSFEAWKGNLIYRLSLDPNFARFLTANVTWGKQTRANPTRGLTADGQDVAQADRQTAAQKVVQLELMLGQVANYCPVISRNAITKNSTSLQDVWQKIRQHYGFQASGGHFLDLSLISLGADERYEDLYERVAAFFDDSLLTVGGGITHNGAAVTVDEEMTPTLENTIVYIWLSSIHKDLPQLIKQEYGAELRNRTLASLKNEISIALTPLLNKLQAVEDTSRALRAFVPPTNRRRQFRPKSCILCKTAGRPHDHFLSTCRYLPEADCKAIARTRMVNDVEDPAEDSPSEDDCDADDSPLIDKPAARRVDVIQSPCLNVYYGALPVKLTLDTGATTNMVLASFARRAGIPIKPAKQAAKQADGITPLKVLGEVHIQLTRGEYTFQLDGLVVDRLDSDILAGTPFLTQHDIATRPAKCQIVIHGRDVVYYGNDSQSTPSVRRAQAYLVRAPPRKSVILPGDFLELNVSDADGVVDDSTWALEPRFDSSNNKVAQICNAWPPPQEIEAIGTTLRVTNTTTEPIVVKRNEHLCQVRPVSVIQECLPEVPTHSTTRSTHATHATPYSAPVAVDPDKCLPQEVKEQFLSLHAEFDHGLTQTYLYTMVQVDLCKLMSTLDLSSHHKGRDAYLSTTEKLQSSCRRNSTSWRNMGFLLNQRA